MSKNDFLVEIGTEELPPKELPVLEAAFAELLKKYLSDSSIPHDECKTFASPRRIAVLIKNLADTQPEQHIIRIGPALKAAYDSDSNPTKAALGFAASCGVDLKEIGTKDDKLYFTKTAPGQQTVSLLPAMVEKALSSLPVKKAMRWGNGDIAFVRPIHWILMLYGRETISANIWGIETSNYTYGHRVHSNGKITIDNPEQYEKKLEAAHVIASYQTRHDKIRHAVELKAKQENAVAVIDEKLLDMVCGLVEWPVALVANFKTEFLRIPRECLISAMEEHQKCFAMVQDDKLLAKFVLISNLESSDPKTVVRGNELVMHARLADAAFHYENDLKQKLQSRVEQLRTVTYQKKLGSLYDKTVRIQQLAAWIAPIVGANTAHTKRAAYLCKADLLCSMVYEFPELQGTMGMYYALHDGEEQAVAHAIEQHYKPRFAQDALPAEHEGICVAIADRVDSIAGLYSVGIKPTGDKDPYGLRRQSLAILRIMIEKNINIDLVELFNKAYEDKFYPANYQSTFTKQIVDFFSERLKAWYLDKNFAAKTFASVEANNITCPLDFDKRIRAVAEFQTLQQAENLAAANKRVQNILAKNPANGAALNESLCTEPAEKELLTALKQQWNATTPLLENSDYAGVLKSLAELQKPVDNFFEHVMVMVDDEKVRNNRLNLVQQLRELFLKVADVSLL